MDLILDGFDDGIVAFGLDGMMPVIALYDEEKIVEVWHGDTNAIGWFIGKDPVIEAPSQPTTTMYELGGEPPYTSASFLVGRTYSWYMYTALLKFSLNPIPPGATILSAKLEMYAETTGSLWAAQTYVVNVVKESWILGQANFQYRQGTTEWQRNVSLATPNNSFSDPVASLVVPRYGEAGWRTWDIDPAAIKNWVDGTQPNYGLVVKALARDAVTTYASSESANPPVLTVNYI